MPSNLYDRCYRLRDDARALSLAHQISNRTLSAVFQAIDSALLYLADDRQPEALAEMVYARHQLHRRRPR